MLTKYSEKNSKQRKDYIHKITTQSIKDYDVITIENFKYQNMLTFHKLSKAIANQSW